jgi:hypothetical protein
VKGYTYLGIILTNTNKLRPRIEKIITNATEPISTHRRKKKYKSVRHYRPVATYGAKSWALNKDTAKRLVSFERKFLRSMLWGIKVNEN